MFLLYSSLVSWRENIQSFCNFKMCRRRQTIFTPESNIELELAEEEEDEEEKGMKKKVTDMSCNLSLAEGRKKQFC